MPLKAVLESLDGVEESVQGFYKEAEKDEKVVYILDIEGVDDHPSTLGLKTSRDRLLKEKKETAAQLREAQEKINALPEDFDVERWEELKVLADAHEQDPDNKDIHKQIETATKAVRDQYEAKIDTLKAKHETEKSQLAAERDKEKEFSRKNLVQSVITKALTENNIKPALMDAASLLIERRIEVIEEDDEETGERERRVLMKPEYGGEDPSKFIQSWVQTDAGKEFVMPATGTNSTGNNRHRANEVNPWMKDTWNLTDQGRVLREDRAKAERMAKAAGLSIPQS